MALEVIDARRMIFAPGPFDPHMHLRATDPLTDDAFVEINGGVEGKAGVAEYTRAALYSGFVGGIAMPNEMIRKYNPSLPERTFTEPYPISNMDKVNAMQSAIHAQAYIPIGVYAGIDPEEIFDVVGSGHHFYPERAEAHFMDMKDDVMGLKLWGSVSTGGFNIPMHAIPRLASIWHDHNPEKPIILHVEDEKMPQSLADIARLPNGKEIPIHIAHVSSRQELEAVMAAKEAGMNVTCEVTIHHLFMDSSIADKIGGYGCMKPGLKSQEDIDFLWANMDSIDIIASDCAPHRVSDKENNSPAFGVTNHTVMLPLLLGAASQGRISYEEIFQKMCIAPRKRFNVPVDDSETHISLEKTDIVTLEQFVAPRYGQNPFTKIEIAAPMIGRITRVKAGVSDTAVGINTSYTHSITPRATRSN